MRFFSRIKLALLLFKRHAGVDDYINYLLSELRACHEQVERALDREKNAIANELSTRKQLQARLVWRDEAIEAFTNRQLCLFNTTQEQRDAYAESGDPSDLFK
jgi:hypothetical protein